MCELGALGPELTTMLACLLDDIEKGKDWPAFLFELTTSMTPKEKDLDSTATNNEGVMAGSAMAMRPINNATRFTPAGPGQDGEQCRHGASDSYRLQCQEDAQTRRRRKSHKSTRSQWSWQCCKIARSGYGAGLGKVLRLDQQRNWRRPDDTIDDAGIFRGGLQLCLC